MTAFLTDSITKASRRLTEHQRESLIPFLDSFTDEYPFMHVRIIFSSRGVPYVHAIVDTSAGPRTGRVYACWHADTDSWRQTRYAPSTCMRLEAIVDVLTVALARLYARVWK